MGTPSFYLNSITNPSVFYTLFLSLATETFIFNPKRKPLIKKIAPDKWKHFFAGIALGLIIQLILCFILPAHFLLSAIATLILVIAGSYGFELISLITGKGHYEVLDAVASTIGGIIGMALVLIPSLLLSVFH